MSKYQPLITRLQQAVLGTAGTLPQAARLAVAHNQAVPPALQKFVGLVHQHAYKVTDEDITALHSAGYDDDQIFEAVISAAVGASRSRLDSALNLLHKGKHEA